MITKQDTRQFAGRWMAAIALLVAALVLGACAAPAATVGAPENGDGGDSHSVDMPEATEEPEEEAYEEYPEAEETEAAQSEYAPLPPIAGDEEDAARGDSGTTGGAGGGAPGSSGEVAPNDHPLPTLPPIVVPPDVQLQPMRAGEIDDNEAFSAYLQYRLDYKSFVNYPVHDIDVSERYIIRVMNQNSRPVLGADVTFYAGQNAIVTLHSPATGIVYFFPRAYVGTSDAQSFTVIVERDQTEQAFDLPRNGGATADVTLDVSATRAPVNLDVLFLIDATGSMGDEIDQLKNNILSISAQISALPSQPNVRYGMVSYRDHGDSYVTQVSDFTRNVQDFQQSLMNVFAGGGGDDPEALQEALAAAVYNVDWVGGETVQLVFLVADAPPHLDYAQDYPYNQTLFDAANRGIKIQPIASRLCEEGRTDCSSERRAYSEQAEYIFRQMAQFTGGHFLFLTYGDTPQSSGEPGSDTHTDEDSYSVQDLDALVIRLITDELAALEGGQQ